MTRFLVSSETSGSTSKAEVQATRPPPSLPPLPLAGVLKRLEVLRGVGGAGALVGAGGGGPLSLRDEVAGAGERRRRLPVRDDGVAAGGVEGGGRGGPHMA